MTKILIADDHPVFRQGLMQALQAASEEIVVEEASNGQEVLSKIFKSSFDAVFLDISMPGRNGLEVLQELKRVKPDVPVLILSMYSEDQYAVRAMKAGASGYLTKDGDPTEFVSALKRVLAGKVYFSSNVVEQLISGYDNKDNKPAHELLSDREYQVMRMIASGQKLKDIADELSLSLSAVSTHRTRILRKMNMKSNADIIRYALREGLVE